MDFLLFLYRRWSIEYNFHSFSFIFPPYKKEGNICVKSGFIFMSCGDWPVGLTSSCSPASQSPSWAAARATLHLQSPVSTSTSHSSGMEARQGHSLSLHTTASPDTDLCTPQLSTNTEWALHWNLKLEKLLFSLLEFESFPASWIKSINCVEIELNIDKWEHRGDQLLAVPASDPPHRVPGSAGGDNLLHLNRQIFFLCHLSTGCQLKMSFDSWMT